MIKKLCICIPVSNKSILKDIGNDINKVLGKYILSQLFLSAIIAVLTFISLMILKVDYAIVLSILNGMCNIIPYVGPIFGAIPAIIIALIQSPKLALWTTIVLYIIQQIEGDIISPKITGNSINMHPLTVILLVIIGGKIGGIIGMILVIPITVVLKVIYNDLDYYMY
jgi:predicted PurR-regulated permease PerM